MRFTEICDEKNENDEEKYVYRICEFDREKFRNLKDFLMKIKKRHFW
jgi:hypothetical protein